MTSVPHRTTARDAIIQTQTSRAAESTALSHRKTWRTWGGVCFVIAMLAIFAQPLWQLMSYAARSELYSYILLIPFVSAYLLYLRRDQLPKKSVADLPFGVVLLACSLGIFLFARLHFAGPVLANNSYFVLLALSFFCCLAAGGFFFLGRNWMQAAAFPLAYLIFIVPMPDAMADALETASKYASAEVANVLFHLSGTPFLRAGLFFQLPTIQIEVAQECSGIHSSWVLLLTSILASNLFLKTPWRRFVLVAFVIPLAILRNGFRILVIGLLCVNVGPQMIHSVIHRRGGPVFFVLSLIPLLLALWWLRRSEIRTSMVESRRVA
jgi:exosortase C (VPDSG-CTERM-specific)